MNINILHNDSIKDGMNTQWPISLVANLVIEEVIKIKPEIVTFSNVLKFAFHS